MPKDVSSVPPLQEPEVVRKPPSDLPRIEDVDPGEHGNLLARYGMLDGGMWPRKYWYPDRR